MKPSTVIRDPEHPDYPHGTFVGSSRGCKCDKCKEALKAYNRAYYARNNSKAAGTRPEQKTEVAVIASVPRVSSENMVKRLRALVSIGYTPERLADLLAVGEGITWWLLVSPPSTIRITLERRVRIIFRSNYHRDLIDTPRAIRRAKALAASFGWPHPHEVLDLDARPEPTTGETE